MNDFQPKGDVDYLQLFGLSIVSISILSPIALRFLWSNLSEELKLRIVSMYYLFISLLSPRWLFSKTFRDEMQRTSRRAYSKALKLDPPTFKVKLFKNVKNELSNGEILFSDLYCPWNSTSLHLDTAEDYVADKKIRNASIIDFSKDASLNQSYFLERIRHAPIILIRTPYNKEHWGDTARLLAERGYHAMVQDTRGRFGSSDTSDFFPIKWECEDGALTLEWLRKQPFIGEHGEIGTYGISYMGLCALATVGGSLQKSIKPPDFCIPVLACSRIFSFIRPFGSFNIGLGMRWLYIVITLMQPMGEPDPNTNKRSILGGLWFLFRLLFYHPELDKAFMHTPIITADEVLTGTQMDFFNDFIRNLKGTEPFWEDKDYLIKNLGDHAKNGNLPPILWLAGWHDFFLNQTLEDFMNSQINQDTKLYVLGMAHWDIYKYYGKLLREIFSFVREHAAPMAKGSRGYLSDLEASGGRGKWERAHEKQRKELLVKYDTKTKHSKNVNKKVRVFVMGNYTPILTRSFSSWPPKCKYMKMHFGYEGSLSLNPNHGVGKISSNYIYDPLNPTPFTGGATFDPRKGGSRNQKHIERREDVLTFTSAPLKNTIEICGNVFANIYFSSSAYSFDIVGRLCCVNTKNESFNVTEGLVRLNKDNYRKPTIEKDGIFNVYRDLEHCPVKCVWISDDETKNDNIVCVKVPLGTTAYRFMPGERIRVQICSGCHPRWMRNYGTKESVNDLANATKVEPAFQEVFHTSELNSQLMLPIHESTIPSNL